MPFNEKKILISSRFQKNYFKLQEKKLVILWYLDKQWRLFSLPVDIVMYI